MPIPKPHKDETRSDFISRCMGNSTMVKEFPDAKQRGGVCATAWSIVRDKGTLQLEPDGDSILVDRVNRMINVNFSITPDKHAIRREFRNGKEFLVIPIVALLEGVHDGSMGPSYYPENEIRQSINEWEGVPLTIGHPNANGNPISVNDAPLLVVGTFESVIWNNGKLKGEGWIDIAMAESNFEGLIAILESGVLKEVSTGLFTDGDQQGGSWQGEEFSETVRNYRPDHLALLPNAEGACSWADGCGVRVNKKKCNSCNFLKGGKVNVKEKEHNLEEVKVHSEECPIINELGFGKVREILARAVDSMDKPGTMNFLREVFSKHFIFEKKTEGEASIMFKQDYSIKEDTQEVKFKNDPQEVVEDNNFIDVNSKGDVMADKKQDKNDEKQVLAIIANERMEEYTEIDRDSLFELDPEVFSKLSTLSTRLSECGCGDKEEKKIAANEEKKEEIKAIVKEGLQANQTPKPVDINELLENADEATRGMWQMGMQTYQAQRSKMVSDIVANSEGAYTLDNLKDTGMDELSRIHTLAMAQIVKEQGKPIYVGNGFLPTHTEFKKGERRPDGKGVPIAPTVNWGKK